MSRDDKKKLIFIALVVVIVLAWFLFSNLRGRSIGDLFELFGFEDLLTIIFVSFGIVTLLTGRYFLEKFRQYMFGRDDEDDAADGKHKK